MLVLGFGTIFTYRTLQLARELVLLVSRLYSKLGWKV